MPRRVVINGYKGLLLDVTEAPGAGSGDGNPAS